MNSSDKYPATADPIARGSGRINSNTAHYRRSALRLPTVSGFVTLPLCENVAQNFTLEFRSLDGKLRLYDCPVTLKPACVQFIRSGLFR